MVVTETDLGEFIIQLNREAPSHIIAPAMHKRRAEVAAILQRAIPCNGDDIVSLTGAARTHLRKKFIAADMGVSGANFFNCRHWFVADSHQRRQRPHDRYLAARPCNAGRD